MTSRRRVLLFLSIAYGLSITIGTTLWLLDVETGSAATTVASLLTMMSPAIAALVVQKASGEALFTPIGGRLKWSPWLLWAAVFAFAVSILVALVSGLMPGVQFTLGLEGLRETLSKAMPADQVEAAIAQMEALPVSPLLLGIPQVLVAGCTINALFAFGEELGWRGFLQRELAPLGFWRSSFLIGVAWGFWHAPLVLNGHNYPDDRVAGVFLFTLVCVLMSPMHAWATEKAGSAWAAATMHGTINAAAGFTVLVTVGGGELLKGMQGLAGVIALVAVNVGLWAWRARSKKVDQAVAIEPGR